MTTAGDLLRCRELPSPTLLSASEAASWRDMSSKGRVRDRRRLKCRSSMKRKRSCVRLSALRNTGHFWASSCVGLSSAGDSVRGSSPRTAQSTLQMSTMAWSNSFAEVRRCRVRKRDRFSGRLASARRVAAEYTGDTIMRKPQSVDMPGGRDAGAALAGGDRDSLASTSFDMPSSAATEPSHRSSSAAVSSAASLDWRCESWRASCSKTDEYDKRYSAASNRLLSVASSARTHADKS
jgi:hypothetical protein